MAMPAARHQSSGTLLGPADFRGGEGFVLFGGGGEDVAVFRDNDGARAAGANVDSKDEFPHE